MIDKQELTKRLMATFLEELHEHTGAWSDHLLALEKGPSGPDRSELLKSLFRSAHSLKGAARAVGVGLIEQVCHRLEDLLADVRDGQRALTPELISLFLEAADAIEEAGMRLREEQRLTDSPLSAFAAKLDRLPGSEPAGTPLAGETEAKPAAGNLVALVEPAPAAAQELVAGQSAANRAALVAELRDGSAPEPAVERGRSGRNAPRGEHGCRRFESRRHGPRCVREAGFPAGPKR